ncbi:MAG: ATP-dependent RecD-like DNA helicase [Selenomonadaceae bacterium]|nr:ATP-dependent RecD-like DNA helicase [Selenomonadaceae bacterium]
MLQHISIRVPWHDNDWNGTVCAAPTNNNACLRLPNIAGNRNDKTEVAICGQCMANHADDLICIGEGACFMSPREIVKETTHPYKQSSKNTHGHFLPTEVIYPAYSFPGRPFAWTMKHNIERLKDIYNIDYRPEREPELGFDTIWVQEAKNQKAIFDCFYGDVVENESLCIAYAKQVPFVEDNRRVIVAIGHVKKIIPAVEHNHTNEKNLRSMTWETMICHSIRENHEDGFVIPYRQMMEYAETHPDFDMASITVFAPDDAFDQFSYATEHVSYDAVIDVIQSCIKAFSIINECLDEDYTNVLDWLNRELSKVWEDRGAFPGLGAMLCALGISQGVIIAKRMQENMEKDCDIWERLDALIDNPKNYLEPLLAKVISPIMQETWKKMKDERKMLFRLLSRFSVGIEQANILFNKNEREKNGINCTDKEIIENPYVIYERTRLKSDFLYVSVKTVDRAVFPVPSILEKYPLEAPTALTSDDDKRRVRAIAVAVLEDEALKGNTILPCDMLVDKIREMILDPKCKVTKDILNAISNFLCIEILRREMKDGTEYYKLVRLDKFDKVIETRIKKRLRAEKLSVNVDWRKLLDEKFGKGNLDSDEERARCEKAAVLEELSCSRIGVLVGSAGTGKTTVLSVLCNQPDIKVGGILLLAPTGKATVRLMDSMGNDVKELTALNVAQFLARSKRFDWYDMRYKLSSYDCRDVPKTVIIDEASMLTEEMFGALMEALKSAERIIFVGDPNQLPPIGAGRPFVDLINLLKTELKAGVFPKVCNCYGELTVNRRQNSTTTRLDVELAKFFTNAEEVPDNYIIKEIAKGNSDNISIITWSDKDDLENKLLKIMATEIGMMDVDDQEGFDLSLGGKKWNDYVYFNTGCAEYADKWQILAPVRNMPQGVMNINRLIHLKYREKLLAVSKFYGQKKRIPKAIGPESIVYGDKVINVVNASDKKAWSREGGGRNYIANGEIGIACSCYFKQRANNYLKVEFSSQKGFLYSYTKEDFDDEKRTAPLELAYALTVHKSQGSQFDKVILVLAEPCRIMSRELLYTALTRQVEKIIILYNQEAYHLFKYSSEENSDIARRFTDLFADIFYNGDLDMRPQIVKVGNQFYEDKLVHRTARGELVRSKSEVIIADALHYHKLDYVYEPELVLEGKVYRPDFKIEDADTGDLWYWEHCGMMDNPKYKKRWENKKVFYKKNGIEEGKNLIVTYDEEGALDSRKLNEIIKEIFK